MFLLYPSAKKISKMHLIYFIKKEKSV